LAIDPTTGYALSGSIAANVDGLTDPNHAASLLSKMKLYDSGAVPTVAGRTTNYHDNSLAYGSVTGSTSMVIDTGLGLANLASHYAYVGTTGGRVMKVQLFPPDAGYPGGDPDAAPKVVNVFSPGGPLFSAAIDSTYAYFLPANTGTITRMKLSDNSFSTISGVPSAAFTKAEFLNNTLYLQALGSAIVEANLGNVTNGVLNSYTSIPIASAAGTFVVDPTQPYAYTGTTQASNQVLNPNQATMASVNATFTKTNLSSGQLAGSPVQFTMPSIVPANQNDHSILALTKIDPDSHAIIVGTDNNLPGNIVKFTSGGNSDVSPSFAGAIQMPYSQANYDPPTNNFPYRVGDINMRAATIDPRSGYAYFGTDTNTPHLLEVQYSQKGSIKGNKVSLPAGAALSSVNFYANMPASASAYSTGNVRLAIYGDSEGMPGQLIWQSGNLADNVPAGGGWLSVTTGLPGIATAGDYWLAWQVDSTLDIPSFSPGQPAHGFSFNQAFGAFPASISGAGSAPVLTSDQWSMYVQFNPFLLGDFNRDGQVTAADLPVMLQALTDLAHYQAQFGLSDDELKMIGDLNPDGVVDDADIQDLLHLLISGSNAPAPAEQVPEPSSAIPAIFGFGGLFLLHLRRNRRRSGLLFSRGSSKYIAAAGILIVGNQFLIAPDPASALTFNVSYDASTAAAPADFFTAFDYAIQFYETNYSNPITINLQVGWGEVAGQTLIPGVLGESSAGQPGFFNFSNVKSALVGHAKSASDLTSVANMPATDPTNNATFKLTRAQSKALGFMNGSAAGVDGSVGFSTTQPFTFDPNHRAVAGKADFIGLAGHEITEVMGRYGLGQNGAPSGRYGALDFFRYTSPGVLDLVPENGAYFSIDGGTTVINTFNGTGGGDLSDWAGLTNDSYNASLNAGVKLATSEGDLIVMDVIGYDRVLPGDFNRDGLVSGADIPAMLAALTDLDAYKTSNSLTDSQLQLIGDLDGDGSVTNADLQRLLSTLIHFGMSSPVSGSASPVSEPTSFLMAVMCGMAISISKRRRGGT
jgi:hypothetical protein